MTKTKQIEVSSDVYELLQQIKEVFVKITGKEDVSEEDVIATLGAGFMDGMQQQQGWCCGGQGKEKGSCESGSCAC